MCGLPNWLDVSLERVGGPCYRVVMEGMALEYQASPCGPDQYGATERIRPRGQAWRDFLTALEAISFWQWQPEYQGGGADGVRWSIEIAQHYRTTASSGINAYPDGEAFPQFCAALSALIERPFA